MNELFQIHKPTSEELEKLSNSPEGLHVHDYEELLVGIEGDLEHFIDFNSHKYSAPYISFVTKGKMHRAVPLFVDNKSSLWLIKFKSEFIPEITFQLYSFYHNNANLQLKKGECFNRMVTLCEMMSSESQQPTPDFAVIQHLLSALFIMIESQRKMLEPVQNNIYKTQNITFKNFLKILEENFRRPEGVEYYSEKLFMSTRNLNLICHNILQQSVSEIIETRKLIEAKNLLISTEKSISEIGYELSYNEKAYFTNVFKKRTGQTPTEFRAEMRKLIS